jgi:cellulose biosynthesis protein BcsQ
VAEVRRFLDNKALRIAGIVVIRTASNNVSREVVARVREAFGPLVHPTTIPTNAKVEEAHSRFQSVLDCAPRSTGAKAYATLVTEIIADGDRAKNGAGVGTGHPDEADHAA